MKKTLVIVESPAKAKTIGKYLGKEYVVKASVGHIKDLPKKILGVDVESGFEPSYEVIKGKKKVLDEIKLAASTAGKILLALDPDREGEAIAWHISEEIQKKVKKVEIHRILFNEITKKSIQEAVGQPKVLDKNLYEAQQARRVLDRLVGYQVSPVLWEKVRRGLSAGRVQTVAVRLVCEREGEIKAFKPEEYWTLIAKLLGSQAPAFEARLVSIQGEKAVVGTEADSQKIVKALQKGSYTLDKIVKKERKRNPLPPFITSKLQQDAVHKLNFSAKRTMVIAQQLYEGIEMGEEGSVGLITYMRTDSTRVSDQAIAEARDLIKKEYGEKALPTTPNIYKGKKGAQDAHEAIRPTNVSYTPKEVKEFLEPDQYKLYSLIWKRFVASQMNPAIYDQTAFEIQSGIYGLRANGSILKEQGYRAVYSEDAEEKGEADDDSNATLPLLKEGETLKLEELVPAQHFTEPPPRFTEASLIKELEEKGIGRPSTYAAILSNIQDKKYVEKEQGRFSPTRLGTIVNDLLVANFPDIFSVTFTAQMEEELDEVEEGRRSYKKTMTDFYAPFQKTLANAKENMKDIKRQEIKTEIQCDKCQSPMVIKWGRRGEFIACTNYPECKNTGE
ncbi:MAG: type I DNA topoisomerase, partial [bacterium]|nr:type I DNA topoisomerase [bacterium]